MQKNLHLDLVGGIAGDMFVSSLIELLPDMERFNEIMSALPIKDWKFSFIKRLELGISANMLELNFPEHNHDLESARAIAQAIKDCNLPEKIKRDALNMLDLLAHAEAKVHGKSVEDIHFHELAGYDLIFDLLAASTCIYLLAPDQITCSALPMGVGKVLIAHGLMPLPAPATLELLKDIPVQATDIKGETVTPTGAVIVRYFVKEFVPFATGTIKNIGIGAGRRENEKIPNIIRAVLLEQTNLKVAKDKNTTSLLVIESNIDDMNPEYYDWIFDRLFEADALDVWLQPIIMKKGRPAQTLSVLAKVADKEKLIAILFHETTTIGVREYPVERQSLERTLQSRDTPFGEVMGKLIKHPEGDIWIPEYDELKRLAKENKVSILKLQRQMPDK